MKRVIMICLVSLGLQSVFAQSGPHLKLSLKDKQLGLSIIGGDNVRITGYDGDDLLIETLIIPKPSWRDDDLKDVTSLFQKESAEREPFNVNERQPSFINVICNAKKNELINIKVPRSLNFAVSFYSMLPNGKLTVDHLAGKVSLSGSVSSVEASYMAGPLTINTRGLTTQPARISVSHMQWQDKSYYQLKNAALYGQLTNVNLPALIIGSDGNDIDLSLPSDLDAYVDVKTGRGKLYSDMNLVTRSVNNSNDRFYGELNGGGVHISLSSTYGNIYLRKE